MARDGSVEPRKVEQHQRRQLLARTLEVSVPDNVVGEHDGQKIVLSRPSANDRCERAYGSRARVRSAIVQDPREAAHWRKPSRHQA